jgi:hypothetical protein
MITPTTTAARHTYPKEAQGPSRDQDIHKGAVEDGCPSGMSNAPALDADGLPNDAVAIAQDAMGAQYDCSQG